MNKATRATSIPIKNRPALTPSITPNKGSAIIQIQTINPHGQVSDSKPVEELLKPYLPRNVLTGTIQVIPTLRY
jgi:hypothetical protein